MKVKETVSEEARKDQWGIRSIDKVQHTEERLLFFKEDRVGGRASVTIDEERVLRQG